MFAHERDCGVWCHEAIHCRVVEDLDGLRVELQTAEGRTFLTKSAPTRHAALNEAEYLRLLVSAGSRPARRGSLKPFVLLIDDDAQGCEEVLQSLRAEMRILAYGAGADAVVAARELLPDLIILGSGASDGCADVVCRVLRDDDSTMSIPIIALAPEAGRLPDFGIAPDAVLNAPCQAETLAAAARLFVRHLSRSAEGY